MKNFSLHLGLKQGASGDVYSSSNWNLKVMVFVEGGKRAGGKNPRVKKHASTNNILMQPTAGCRVRDLNSGHIGRKSALISAHCSRGTVWLLLS